MCRRVREGWGGCEGAGAGRAGGGGKHHWSEGGGGGGERGRAFFSRGETDAMDVHTIHGTGGAFRPCHASDHAANGLGMIRTCTLRRERHRWAPCPGGARPQTRGASLRKRRSRAARAKRLFRVSPPSLLAAHLQVPLHRPRRPEGQDGLGRALVRAGGGAAQGRGVGVGEVHVFFMERSKQGRKREVRGAAFAPFLSSLAQLSPPGENACVRAQGPGPPPRPSAATPVRSTLLYSGHTPPHAARD